MYKSTNVTRLITLPAHDECIRIVPKTNMLFRTVDNTRFVNLQIYEIRRKKTTLANPEDLKPNTKF